MGCPAIRILCSTDYAVIATENEDNLQGMLFKYNQSAEQYNTQISIEKKIDYNK